MILRHHAIPGRAGLPGKLRTGSLLGLLLAILLGLAPVASGQAAPRASGAFTVADVPVDATAASASAARDAARLDGQRRAFRILLERLTAPADRDRLPRVSDQMLTDELVQDFEVTHERSSAVRYLGTYTFRFRPEAVRRLLRQAGIAFAETASKPLVVLPVLRAGDRMVLWDDPNPWRDAWANRHGGGGLVELVLPLGELADVQAIDADGATRGDAAALAAISQRYGNGDVLVVQATLGTGSPKTLATTATRYTAGNPGQPITGSYRANAGESDADLMARAIADLTAQLEDAWKRQNTVHFDQSGTLTAVVPISDLKDWIAVRQGLSGLPAIQRYDVISLDRQQARLEIHYFGDPGQLSQVLAQRDLVLTQGDPDWTLARRSAGALPAP